MLPTTPLHFLLWYQAQGLPLGTDWLKAPSELLLVMTSANPQGEALVINNDEALERLAGIADVFLLHNRDIVVRDDSVNRSGPSLTRRARGYTPVPIALSGDGPDIAGIGAYLKKNTVCLMKGCELFYRSILVVLIMFRQSVLKKKRLHICSVFFRLNRI